MQLDWADAPVVPATTPDGRRCIVDVPLGRRSVRVSTWRLRLGRATVYLLDTDLEDNAPWDRGLTARLYGGDRETRIQQEIVLGLDGVRALRALGESPTVWHLNEGHAGFVVLQRIREGIEAGQSFESALEHVRATTVFTTHTPVAAGHDAFPFELVQEHLAGAWEGQGSDRDAFFALGSYSNDGAELFNMTALALRSSAHINGVSTQHGQVTRRMWGRIWPGTPEDERPVGAITNGIHLPTWMSGAVVALIERHLGPGWREHQDDQSYWDRLMAVPNTEVWDVRRALRRDLFAFIRERARQRWAHDGVSAARMMAGMLLDPDALTIGFARRFTAYKRPELVFQDEAPHPATAEHRSAGPVGLCREGSSRRRPRQAPHPADRGPDAGSAILRTDRIHRRLRRPRGVLSGAGLQRLAQHAAQAARGQRHERHEGPRSTACHT